MPQYTYGRFCLSSYFKMAKNFVLHVTFVHAINIYETAYVD